MPDSNQENNHHCDFLICRPSFAVSSPEFGKVIEATPSRPIRGTLTTDVDGWPKLTFDREDWGLVFVSEFLQSDVDILLPACELLLEKMTAVGEGRLSQWTWNGNSYLIEFEREQSTLVDKYGDGDTRPAKATIDTNVLFLVVEMWKRFVAQLPRQRELAAAEHALHPL